MKINAIKVKHIQIHMMHVPYNSSKCHGSHRKTSLGMVGSTCPL